MASTSQTLDPTAATAKVQTLLNRYLVNILKAEGLPHSGIKAGMQQRIIGRKLNLLIQGLKLRSDQLRLASAAADVCVTKFG